MTRITIKYAERNYSFTFFYVSVTALVAPNLGQNTHAFAIPAFMYLMDYREQTIKDVITQIEPELFKKVTGLSIKAFDILYFIGLFDPEKMNQGIFRLP